MKNPRMTPERASEAASLLQEYLGVRLDPVIADLKHAMTLDNLASQAVDQQSHVSAKPVLTGSVELVNDGVRQVAEGVEAESTVTMSYVEQARQRVEQAVNEELEKYGRAA